VDKAAATANIKASDLKVAVDKAAEKALNVKVSMDKAANIADVDRQQKVAEKQRKIDGKKKTAQAALEAKEVTPNRILEELYDEVGNGPFNKSENYPFDKRGNDPLGSLY